MVGRRFTICLRGHKTGGEVFGRSRAFWNKAFSLMESRMPPMFQSFVDGLHWSYIASSLLPYLEKDVKVKDEKVSYGLITAIFNLNPMVFGILVSRWIDHTRKAKQGLILCTILTIVGSALYMMPFSQYLLLWFLQGFVVAMRPIMTAEMARSYPNEALATILPYLAICTLSRAGIGPVVKRFFFYKEVFHKKVLVNSRKKSENLRKCY